MLGDGFHQSLLDVLEALLVLGLEGFDLSHAQVHVQACLTCASAVGFALSLFGVFV